MIGHVTFADGNDEAFAERRLPALRGRSRRRCRWGAVGCACGCAGSRRRGGADRRRGRALGRPEVRVAEHLLDRAEVGSALEQVGRERVA